MSAIESAKGATSYLDIGCGFGKYGVLLRERSDVRFKRYNRKDWTTIIDCVDAWGDYITELHKHVYSNIYIGDINSIVDHLPSYDVIIMLDIIEHMEKKAGETLLKKIYNHHLNKLLVLSFPAYFHGHEGSDWDNPYECHKCLWKHSDLVRLFLKVNKHSQNVFSIEKVPTA